MLNYNYSERPELEYYGSKNDAENPSILEHQARYTFAADVFREMPKKDRLADFGCATGGSTRFLLNLLANQNQQVNYVLGIDIDEGCIAKAQSLTLPNVPIWYLSADISSPNLLDSIPEKFDGISFIEVLEHLPPEFVQQALSNVKRLLTPETGRLVISTPNRAIWANNRFSPFNPFHHQELNRFEFIELLNEAGFHLEGMYGQKQVSSHTSNLLDPLRSIPKMYPNNKQEVGRYISTLLNIQQKDSSVLKLTEDVEPKYLLAVCSVPKI